MATEVVQSPISTCYNCGVKCIRVPAMTYVQQPMSSSARSTQLRYGIVDNDVCPLCSTIVRRGTARTGIHLREKFWGDNNGR